MNLLRTGACLVVLSLPALTAVRGPLRADDSLLPEDPLLRVHVAPLQTLYEAPLAQEIWQRLQTSQSFAGALQTVEARQFLDSIAFVEQKLGRSWQDLYAGLTAGGVDLAVSLEGQPQVLLVAHATDEGLPQQIVDLAVELVQAEGGDATLGEHRGFTGYRIGNAAVAAAGTHLLVGSDPELLKAAVDRLLDDPPATGGAGDEPFHITVRLDLQQLRSIPDFARGLAIPAADGGAIAVFGGWIDLLQRHASAELALVLGEEQVEARLRFAGADEPSPDAFAGFWADAPHEHPAPLLELPGTIYSTSWYRDYGAIWNAREQLVTEEVIARMERGDAEAAAQFETLGSAVSLSEVVQEFGPRFRAVVVEQQSTPYDIELRNPLPEAGLVIELKDEDAFREIASPLARVLHLILSFEQKITSQPIEHNGATLQQLSFPHTDRDIARRDQTSYNFRPTHTITRGHFVIGTSPHIVTGIIDALDQQADNPRGGSEAGVTSRQIVHIPALVRALAQLRDAIVRQSVLEAGLQIETAHHELDVLLSILSLFETKTITGVFTDEGFEQRVRVTAGR